jgi:hypothetical protein
LTLGIDGRTLGGMGLGVRVETLEETYAELVKRLRARRDEIEEGAFARVCAVADPVDAEDAEYVEGLRAALAAALEAALIAIEERVGWAGSLPAPLAAQIRRAVRRGFSLDVVLRRSMAAQFLLEEFIIDEAADLPAEALRELLVLLGARLDRLMELIGDEYRRETAELERFPGRLRVKLVERLLAGQPVPTSELGYELDAWHQGMVVTGAGAPSFVRRLDRTLSCPVLWVLREEESAWLWLGSTKRPTSAQIECLRDAIKLTRVSVVVGEPASGTAGWRLTHRQAQAARWVALRRPGELTHYGDCMLLAAAVKDDVLARSLQDIYLSPLDGHREGGDLARETLRAYLHSECNAATAAAALRVDRHTVERRLRRIEQRLGRPIHGCRAELEVALGLDELGANTRAQTGADGAGPGTGLDGADRPAVGATP